MKAERPADSVESYLHSLTPERRTEIERVREVILRNLPVGYEEVIANNMIVYQVPLERYSDTYNGKPLWYAALDGETKKLALHLMPIYGSQDLLGRLEHGFEQIGRQPDMGKSCVRFKSADQLPLEAVGEIIAAFAVERWIEIARAARRK